MSTMRAGMGVPCKDMGVIARAAELGVLAADPNDPCAECRVDRGVLGAESPLRAEPM